MSDTPTPETDAFFLRNGYPIEVDQQKAAQLCERLEQELGEIKRERDKIKSRLERIARASLRMRQLEEDFAEWEKAVEVLIELCEFTEGAK
jgi:hypothetical protein